MQYGRDRLDYDRNGRGRDGGHRDDGGAPYLALRYKFSGQSAAIIRMR